MTKVQVTTNPQDGSTPRLLFEGSNEDARTFVENNFPRTHVEPGRLYGEGGPAPDVKLSTGHTFSHDKWSDDDVDDVDGDGPIPARSASKDEWVSYAVSQGADESEAKSATKESLISEYGA